MHMSEQPRLNYSIHRKRGVFYADFIFGSRPTDRRRYGPYVTRKAATDAMNQEITSFIAKEIEGELRADFMKNEIKKAASNCENTVCFFKNHKDARLPVFSTEEAVGADLYAVVDDEVVIKPRQRALIKTGLMIANMDKEYELQIRPRSGLALKHGITVLNTPGTIDPDYRGEIGVVLFNTSDIPFIVKTGDRIAQMVPAKRARMFFVLDDENITTTARGTGGFGSTGH